MMKSAASSTPLSLLLLLLVVEVTAFQQYTDLSYRYVAKSSASRRRRQQIPPLNNFFKDLLDNAFDNDPRFLEPESGKRKGQIDYNEYGEDEAESDRRLRQPSTLVQEQWRQRQAPKVTPDLLANTRWTLDLYLAGVPSRDPSNDLFASRENISNRDKALGIQIPDTPTLSVDVTFLTDQTCQMALSEFTTDEVLGQWKVSDDGKQLRFSIHTLGYSRTVETKGSIQSIYGIAWKRDRLYEEKAAYGDDSSSTPLTTTNQAEENTITPPQPKPTSFMYSIPPGWIYADMQVSSRAGSIQMVADTGVLRLEQPRGWIGSVMVPCGKFAAKLQS